MSLLIDAALKGSLLIIAAAVAAYLLRGRSAAARHAAWTAAVIGHLALPALALFLPQWNLGLLPEPSWIRSSVVTAPASQVKEESAPVAMVNESEPASKPASANPTASAAAASSGAAQTAASHRANRNA